jgi:hypothetical protein
MYPFTGLERPMSATPPDRKRLQGAVAARRRVRRRPAVLQVPGNAADAVPCERLCAKMSILKESIMAKKEKRLCKWKADDIEKKMDTFIELVREPKYLCKKCGRVAEKKKWLHKPTALA